MSVLKEVAKPYRRCEKEGSSQRTAAVRQEIMKERASEAAGELERLFDKYITDGAKSASEKSLMRLLKECSSATHFYHH